MNDLFPPPARAHTGHKGDFGRVAIVGGCHDADHVMLGAPVLAARAALRSGCGAAVLLVPHQLGVPALMQLSEATVVPLPVRGSGYLDEPGAVARIKATHCDAMVIGPGLGRSRIATALVDTITACEGPPTVVDADGLTAMSCCGHDPWPAQRPLLLTPHPGEYERLAKCFDLPAIDGTDASRRAGAEALAKRSQAVVVLKGHGTVVASIDRPTWTCARGSEVLAVPGSGDVLTGVVAACVAMSVRNGEVDLFEMARLAVDVHAAAGDRYAATVARRGMLARELADLLSVEFESRVDR
jgi:NAD(P)H-hydrate epimerase